MNAKGFRILLAMAGISLLTVSCGTTKSCGDVPVVTFGKSFTFGDMLKMPPFTAKVEIITIERPFFLFSTSVELWLKTPDSKRRVNLQAYPATQSVIGFARSLRVCETYEFPKVYLDYVNNSATNAPTVTTTQQPK